MESITYGWLWCFISCLDSFWRHPFTAMDPLLSKWYKAKFLQICSHFWLSYSFNKYTEHKQGHFVMFTTLLAILGVTGSKREDQIWQKTWSLFRKHLLAEILLYMQIWGKCSSTSAHKVRLRRGLANVTSANPMLLREIRLWFLFYKAFVCLLQMYAVHVQGHMSNKVERFSLIDGRHRGEL